MVRVMNNQRHWLPANRSPSLSLTLSALISTLAISSSIALVQGSGTKVLDSDGKYSMGRVVDVADDERSSILGVTSSLKPEVKIGDEVCMTNYIMDNFCINRGTILDAPGIMTLEEPEKHSFHCLLDVGICRDSGYTILTDKDASTGMHCLGYRLGDTSEDTDVVYTAGIAAGYKGENGYCTDCTGDATKPEYGYRATVKGTVEALGDGTNGPEGAPLLKNLQVMDASVECDIPTVVNPVCMAMPEVEPAPAEPGTLEDCTTKICETTLTDGFLMRYQVNVPSETNIAACEGCTMSVELVYDGEAWVGIGFSLDGAMVGSEAVIGNSATGVQKYALTARAVNGVQPLPENQQTLTDTSVEVKDGQTTVKFTKIMKEAGEIMINPGDNTFIWAHGNADALGYHAARAPKELNVCTNAIPGSEPANPSIAPPVPEPATSPDNKPENEPAAPAGSALLCPESLDESIAINADASLFYALVPSNPAGSGNGLLCGRLESTNDGWIGLGFSKDGKMPGSQGIVGSPEDDRVRKYDLTGYGGITQMSEDKQTLTDTSFKQEGDMTIMEFTKLLVEEGQIPILEEGETNFLHAWGGNVIGYHAGRVPFKFGTPVPGGGSSPDSKPDMEPNATPSGAPPGPSSPAKSDDEAAAAGSSKDCTKTLCETVLTDGFLMRYQVNVPSETTVDVCEGCTITTELVYDGEAWVGIGYSTDGAMVGSDAVIGNSATGVQKYTLSSKDFSGSGVQPMPESQQTLVDTSVEVKDGQTIVKFTKIMKEAGEIEINPGDNTFIWAHGNADALGYHAARASFDLNLSSGASEELSVPNKAAWLAHGIMAFLAWGVLVPYAVQFSILRDLIPKGPLWFQVHRAFNTTAYLLFICLFAVAVAFTGKEQGQHFGNSHQKMGLAMFIMATFQVAGGLFRPHVPAPDSNEVKTPVRKGWEIGHRVLGVTLLACGFWQMSEGVDLYAIKYSVSDSNEGKLLLAYWVWIGGMSGIIVLGVVYSRLCKVSPKVQSGDTLKSYL